MEIARLAEPPVEGLNYPPLTLWIRTAAQPRAPSLEDVRAHHLIVEAAWTAHPAVLPVRFGQWFGSVEELTVAVGAKVGTYAAALERVREAGEFSVRILDPALPAPEPEGAAVSGTEYLRAAAERARRRSALEERGRAEAGKLEEALRGLVQDERVEPFASAHGLATVTHLVARAVEREYIRAADAYAAERPELRFLRTGPWPAWSFSA